MAGPYYDKTMNITNIPTTPNRAIFNMDFFEILEHKTIAETVPKIR